MKWKNRKMARNPFSDNANTFCRLTTFMIGKKLERKVTPSLNRVKDFLLENHGFEFSRADPILCETVLGKKLPPKKAPLSPGSKPNPDPTLDPSRGTFFRGYFFLTPCETYGEVGT